MPHRKVPMLLLRKIAIPAVLLVALTACGPEIQEVQVQETTEPDANDEPAESQAPTPREVEIEVHDTDPNAALMAERRRFTVITDPWSKYFRTEPTVVILPKLTEGIEGLLIEQQTKAREILSDTGQVADRPEYIHLKEQLEALKSAVPGAETRSGYGHTSRRVYVAPHSYVTPDGRSAYLLFAIISCSNRNSKSRPMTTTSNYPLQTSKIKSFSSPARLASEPFISISAQIRMPSTLSV